MASSPSSFPVWNADTLREFQERKEYVNGKAAEYLQDRDDELQKMQQTSNLFMKALHYRNAAAAVEKYSLQPVRSMAQVPTMDEVLPIHGVDDLFLARTGGTYGLDQEWWCPVQADLFGCGGDQPPVDQERRRHSYKQAVVEECRRDGSVT